MREKIILGVQEQNLMQWSKVEENIQCGQLYPSKLARRKLQGIFFSEK